MVSMNTTEIICIVALFIGAVIIWRSAWNLMDLYIPNTTKINILILLLGIGIIVAARYIGWNSHHCGILGT